MRAVQVKAFGGVDQLELIELPEPQPQPGQVRIRVEACGLNYADVMQREGLYPGGPKPPYVPGLEAAGIVEEGDSLIAGTRVMAMSAGGCYAEKVCVSSTACIPFPDSMSFVDAAAFPVQYLKVDLYAYLHEGVVLFDDVTLKAVGPQNRVAKDKAIKPPATRPVGAK